MIPRGDLKVSTRLSRLMDRCDPYQFDYIDLFLVRQKCHKFAAGYLAFLYSFSLTLPWVKLWFWALWSTLMIHARWFGLVKGDWLWVLQGTNHQPTPSYYWLELLLMAEILHQLIGSLSHYLQGFMHPWWCRISLHQQYGSVCVIYATTVFRVKYMTKRAPFSGRMYTARKTPNSRNYRSQKFHIWSFKTFWMFCLDFLMAMLGLTRSDYLHKHPIPAPTQVW